MPATFTFLVSTFVAATDKSTGHPKRANSSSDAVNPSVEVVLFMIRPMERKKMTYIHSQVHLFSLLRSLGYRAPLSAEATPAHSIIERGYPLVVGKLMDALSDSVSKYNLVPLHDAFAVDS